MRLPKLLSLCVLSLAIALAPATFTGCQSTPESAQATAYRTLKSTQIAVDSAMKIYATKVVIGSVSVERQAKVDAAHAQYRAAFRTAVQAANGQLGGGAPENVKQLADQLQLLITNL